jgi:glycosyltransferase involved in cell wall biosynthesis
MSVSPRHLPLNIALDATYSLGRNLSGVGVYCRRLLWGLAEAHPESRFAFCYRPHRLGRSLREALPANARRSVLLPLLTPSADVFHALNQREPPTRVRRLAVTFHDLFVISGNYSTPEFRDRFTKQAREAAARADRIIAVSTFTAGQVETLLGVDRSRIRVVPHGVDLRPRFVQGAREPVVLHIGAIQKRKNLVRLIEAFAQMPEPWRLVLAGSDGFEAGIVYETARSSRVSGRIEFPGYVDAAQLEVLYTRASVFAFPSLDEGFGIPVLEAMTRGVPVLTSNVSALPEVAADAALLVDPYNVDDIATGLLKLAGDERLRTTLTAKGLERVKLFPWSSAIERTWAAYQELV